MTVSNPTCRKTAFIGAGGNVGCTMLAQSYAEYIAGEEEKTCLLVMNSGKPGNFFMRNERDTSLDDIRANLVSGNLSKEELTSACQVNGKLYILPACRAYEGSAGYSEDSMMVLARAAEECGFEDLVFDCGDRLGSALALSGIRTADRSVLVTAHEPKSVWTARLLAGLVLNPLEVECVTAVNMTQKTLALPSPAQVASRNGQVLAAQIPYVEYGRQAALRKMSLMGVRRYRTAVRKLRESLLLAEGME